MYCMEMLVKIKSQISLLFSSVVKIWWKHDLKIYSIFKMAVVKNLGKGKEEIEITLEDQQQINTFARRNAKMEELKEEISTKKKDLQNLEDASDELLMVEDSLISYKIGEVFMQMSQEETEEELEKARTKIKDEIKNCEEQFTEIQEVLTALKAKLYGKFGDSINLEAEEE